MKGYIVSILIVGLALGGMGLGTFAWFTDKETVEANTIQTGTLDLGVQLFDTCENKVENYVVTELHPGEYKKLGHVDVWNNGTSDLKWRAYLQKTDGDWLPIVVKVTDMENNIIGEYTWTEISNRETTQLTFDANPMKPDDSQQCTIFVKLDDNAGNYYKVKSLKLNIIFDATQFINTGWTQTTTQPTT